MVERRSAGWRPFEGRRQALEFAGWIAAIGIATALVWHLVVGAPLTSAWAPAGMAAGLFAMGAWLSSRCDRTAEFVDRLFESPCVGLVLLDEHGSVVRMTPGARSTLGLEDSDRAFEECQKKLSRSLMRGKNPSYPADDVIQAIEPVIFPEYICEVIPIRLKGRPFSMVVLSDIRQTLSDLRKESDRLRARTIAGLISQIAHEVRNPVAAISGSAQLLGMLYAKSENGDARCGELFRHELDVLCRSIIEQSNRLDNVIARWLAYPGALENNPEKAGLSADRASNPDSAFPVAQNSAARR